MKIRISLQIVLVISLCCPGQILAVPDQLIDARDLDLWPLVTPILVGDDFSQECISASLEYVKLLSESLTLPPSALNDSHRNALKRLDSGGPLPFLEEGILLDTRMTDICTLKLVRELLRENHNITNCYTLPKEKRIFGIPYHTAGSPGLENVCKKLDNSKYCHNYVITVNSDFELENSEETLATNAVQIKEKQFDLSKEFNPKSAQEILQSLEEKTRGHNHVIGNLDFKALPKLSDMYLQNNPFLRNLHSSLSSTLLSEPGQDSNIDVIQVMILLYMRVNGGNGHSPYYSRMAYHGVCYPDACTMDEINLANYGFSLLLFKDHDPKIVSAPLYSFPGCSDDEKYNKQVQNWEVINWVAVIMMSVIGLSVVIGTGLDIQERSKGAKIDKKAQNSLIHNMLEAFSVVSNLEIIFGVQEKKGGARLDCLDGMRAISMTWVILGHHFLAASSWVDGRNKQYSDSIRAEKSGGLALEPLFQDFSVDSFLFIGATLLSYLLLKDLDKTNGWFNCSGPLRIALFYLNRYLRLTIPYGLTILVFAGIFPLVFTEPMGLASFVQYEGEECRKYWFRHLLYYNTFSFRENGQIKGDNCLGQTWYLAFDMQWFLVSPLVVYPLWLAKYGKPQIVAAVSYWIVLFLAFLAPMIAYIDDPYKWIKYHIEHLLPFFPGFAPWGQRSHCYLLGLMMGFILHSTKSMNIKIHWVINLFMWMLSFVLACSLTYGTYNIADYPAVEYKIYKVLVKALWGLCLAWVTFSCVKGHGGPVNDFLSWNVWGTISKISFMTYLFHMSIDWYYYASQTYIIDFSLWHVTSLFIAQLFVDLLVGLLGCLTLELPFGKIQKLILQKIFSGK